MKKRYFIFSTVFIVGLVSLIFLHIPSISVLAVYARKDKSQHFYHKNMDLQEFVISYTHSVNKGRVHDFYEWDDSGILIMRETEFVSYGAGIPEPGETPGAYFETTPDGYFIRNINRKIPRLVMGVGLIAHHTIRFDGKDGTIGEEIPFTDLFEPQTSIILENKKVSHLGYLFHKF